MLVSSDMHATGDPMKVFLSAMEMSLQEGKYVMDAENKETITRLVGYFSRTSTDLSLRRGITLIGNPGSGKTWLLQVMSMLVRNTPWAFSHKPCVNISNDYSKFGIVSLNGICTENYYYEDLGYEPVAKHYSETRDVLHDVIFLSHKSWINAGRYFHLDTNYTKDDIIKRYGLHGWRRIEQMTNVLILGGSKKSKDRTMDSLPRILTEIPDFPKFYTTDQEREIRDGNELVQRSYKKAKEEVLHRVSEHYTGAGDKLAKSIADKLSANK